MVFSNRCFQKIPLKLTLLIQFLRQGSFVARRWRRDNDGSHAFLSLSFAEKITSSPLMLEDDALFCGVSHFFPKFKTGWSLLLRNDDRNSITAFYQGYPYYKRTLQIGADKVESVIETLRYLEKYNIADPKIFYVSQTPFELKHNDLNIQRINADPQEILEHGMAQKGTISFYPPLSPDYLMMSVNDFTKLIAKRIMIPLCALSFLGFLGVEAWYAIHSLEEERQTLNTLKQSLLPKEISAHIPLVQFKTHKIFSVAHQLFEGNHIPKTMTISYASKEMILEFDTAPKIKKSVPANYLMTQKGRKITLKEKA